MNCPRCRFDFCWGCMNDMRSHGILNMCFYSILFPCSLGQIPNLFLLVLYTLLAPVFAVIGPFMFAFVFTVCIIPCHRDFNPCFYGPGIGAICLLLCSWLILFPLSLIAAALAAPFFLVSSLYMQVMMWSSVGRILLYLV